MNIKLRLIIMNFLQFAVWGSYLTSMGSYLVNVNLAGHIGIFYAMQGIVSLFMPAIMGITGMLFANALTAYTTPYLLVNDSIALLPIKIADMFVGDIKQRPGLGSALSIVLLALMLAVLGITNLVKRKFEKGQN